MILAIKNIFMVGGDRWESMRVNSYRISKSNGDLDILYENHEWKVETV